MLRRILFLAVLAASLEARAQDEPAPLTKEQILGAAIGEPVSTPMPSELFAALGKKGKPDWSTLLRKPPSDKFTNRPQLALNLGGLIADGYLAVEAQDAQVVENVARDIRALTKSLGIEQEVVNRGSRIVELAKAGNWDTLAEELEAAQNEVTAAMASHDDQDLVTLVTLGGWLRGTEVVSSFLAKNYSEEGARVLRQPAVVDHFVRKLAAMPKRTLDTDLMEQVRRSLFDIRKAVSYGVDSVPTLDDVKNLNQLASTIEIAISTKKQ
jgi:hypothetical protein